MNRLKAALRLVNPLCASLGFLSKLLAVKQIVANFARAYKAKVVLAYRQLWRRLGNGIPSH